VEVPTRDGGGGGGFDLCGTNSKTINEELQQSNLGYIVHNFELKSKFQMLKFAISPTNDLYN
jgi:hypothetical protein